MGIEKLKRWQWIVLSLLVGWGIGFAWNQLAGEGIDTNFQSLPTESKRVFESALVTTETIVDSKTKKPTGEKRAHFHSLSVLRLPDDRGKPQFAVIGQYFSNMPVVRVDEERAAELKKIQADIDRLTKELAALTASGKDNAKQLAELKRQVAVETAKANAIDLRDIQYQWRPYFYIADYPYKPVTPAKAGNAVQPGALERFAEAIHLKPPDPPNSVITYLRQLSASNPAVQFTYRWWNQPRIRIAGWMAGCFVVIGLIWPTIINIVLFGTFSRPPEEGFDLRRVRSAPASAARPKNQVTEKDMTDLLALEAELEAKLAADARPRSDSDIPQPVADGPIKQLSGDGASSAVKAPEKTEAERAFGGEKDDFYPTERHAPPKRPQK